MQINQTEKNKIMVTIVDRGRGCDVVKFCQEQALSQHLICDGHGTADPQVLQMLGIEHTKRDVVFSRIPETIAQEVLLQMGEYIEFYTPGNGIAFTIEEEYIGELLNPLLSKKVEGQCR